MMGLSGATLARAIAFILTPCLLVSLVLGFTTLTWLFDRAVSAGPLDSPGGRLKSILELPRRVEIFVYVATWIVGAAAFSLITCVTYDRSRLLVVPGAVAGLFASLFLGPVITMQVEDDLRPLALEEFRRGPKVKLEGRGLFWLRQRWYLPYTFGIALLSLVGVGQAEAFQLLFNASGIFYALTYVVMFAIPLFGARHLSEAPPLWLRIASAAGFGVTLLYCTLSVFPIIDVESWTVFAVKIISVLVGANLIGIAIYMVARRRAR